MDRENYEDNISVSIVTNAPQLTVQDAPTNTKVSIWGYELCNGTQWKDFLEVVNKLGKENEQLKQQLAEKDKEIAHLKEITIFKDSRNMTTKINGVDFSDEQIIILQNLDVLKKYDQTQLAIQELEKVKAKVRDVSGALALCEVEVQIDQQIKELKGE